MSKRIYCPRADLACLQDKEFMNYLGGVVAGDGTLCDYEPPRLKGNVRLRVTDKVWISCIYSKVKPWGTLSKSVTPCKNWNPVWGFRISDKVFVEYFIQHGLVSRKSLKKEACMFADEGYEMYFVRGLLDSDGCVSLQKRNGKVYPRVRILGLKFQISLVKDYLDAKSIRCAKYVDKSLWVCSLGCCAVKKFMGSLSDKDYFLGRKTEKMDTQVLL